MGVAASMAVSTHAGAAQVCAWLVESNDADDVRNVDLYLQADKDFDFLLKVGGDGIITTSGKSNSPETATYSLNAGKADEGMGDRFHGGLAWRNRHYCRTAQDPGRHFLRRADAAPGRIFLRTEDPGQ